MLIKTRTWGCPAEPPHAVSWGGQPGQAAGAAAGAACIPACAQPAAVLPCSCALHTVPLLHLGRRLLGWTTKPSWGWAGGPGTEGPLGGQSALSPSTK